MKGSVHLQIADNFPQVLISFADDFTTYFCTAYKLHINTRNIFTFLTSPKRMSELDLDMSALSVFRLLQVPRSTQHSYQDEL